MAQGNAPSATIRDGRRAGRSSRPARIPAPGRENAFVLEGDAQADVDAAQVVARPLKIGIRHAKLIALETLDRFLHHARLPWTAHHDHAVVHLGMAASRESRDHSAPSQIPVATEASGYSPDPAAM